MGLFDFLKRKKKRAEAAQEEAENTIDFSEADLSTVDPPETRFTQEYQDFLETQQAEAAKETASDEQ